MSILSEADVNYIKQNYFNTIDILEKKKNEFSDLMGTLQAIVLFPVDIDFFYDVMTDVSEEMQILFGHHQNTIANRYIDLHFALVSVFSFRARCSDLYDDLRKISNCFRLGHISKVSQNKREKKNNRSKKLPSWLKVVK